MKKTLCWLSALLLTSLSWLSADELPKTNITKIQNLKNEEWSAQAEIDGKSTRSVLPGKRGEFLFANWWGGSVRPPEGEIYVMEILYQDTIKKPARVLSFSGLGSYQGPSELHRIGGANNKEWKTAYVPVSWDLLMLKEKETQIRFYIQNHDKENPLPVADITFRKAKPEDQIRYNQESRDWVKKELEEYAKKVPASDKELDLGEKYNNKSMIPFARPYYDSINRYALPTLAEVEGRVYVRAALNEFEAGSFGVHAQTDLNNITYSLSELKDKNGNKLDCQIKLFTVEYTPLRRVDRKTKAEIYYQSPERLWPAFPENLKKGENAWFWFVIKTDPQKTKPGTYEGVITVTADSAKETLPVHIDIRPITLLTMQEAGLWMGGCVTGLVSEQDLQTMQDYNHNIVNIWFAGVKPELSKGDGKLNLNFYYLDNFMNACRKHGQKRIVWFLGGNPPGFPETLTVEREIYASYYQKPQTEFFKILQDPAKRDKVIPEIRDVYKSLISDTVKHADENQWPELIFTPFDEPVKYSYPSVDKGYKHAVGTGLWTREHFKDAAAVIHEASPKSKVYISMHHNFERKPFGRVGEVFLPDVDIVNTNAIDEDPNLNRKVLDKGKEFWQYSGIQGGRYNFGFYFAVHESTGSLVWAYNWGQRFNSYGKAEAQYAYTSPFGTIVTPQYEYLREGWDDRRYLATYLKLAEKKGLDTKKIMADLKAEVLGNLKETTEDKVEEFYVHELDKNKLERIRAQIAQKIIELSK